MSFIDEILKLSPIVQGALGSALFAIVFWLLKVIFSFLHLRITSINKTNKLNSLKSELIRATAREAGDVNASVLALISLLYIAFSDFIKAVICLCLGYFLSAYLPVFKEISILFALYFFYLSLDSVKVEKSEKSSSDKISELNKQIKEIEAK